MRLHTDDVDGKTMRRVACKLVPTKEFFEANQQHGVWVAHLSCSIGLMLGHQQQAMYLWYVWFEGSDAPCFEYNQLFKRLIGRLRTRFFATAFFEWGMKGILSSDGNVAFRKSHLPLSSGMVLGECTGRLASSTLSCQ